MNKLQRRIKAHLEVKGRCNINQLASYFGVSQYKIAREMEDMINQRLIAKQQQKIEAASQVVTNNEKIESEPKKEDKELNDN